jgi:hypothetical protein
MKYPAILGLDRFRLGRRTTASDKLLIRNNFS